MFDVRADRYVADRFPPVLHVLSIVLAALTRLMVIGAGIAVSMLISGVGLETGSPTFNGVPAIVALLLGWIPALFSLLFMRLGIELVASSARTARNTALLAEPAGPRCAVPGDRSAGYVRRHAAITPPRRSGRTPPRADAAAERLVVS